MANSTYFKKLTALLVTMAIALVVTALVLSVFAFLLTNVYYAEEMLMPVSLIAALFGGLTAGYVYCGRFGGKYLLFALLGALAFAFTLLLLGLIFFGNVLLSPALGGMVPGAALTGGLLGGVLRAGK